ncbi:Gnk2-homologous domain [Arabidopsis thaliana x Arabidopsis arenosa]|uniref:Gnk2-homologous domain n=1 Tax=Arabidopsis thaliana x Arabidopsis arenosa TaxID=1240361 RepID=A0A8T2AU82_9BRAS|nr:Gnk2-homologous domain [Arabidopsis thaliana x Arabidopsis arenosa]
MYSSSSISKRLVLVPIMVVMATQLLLMRTVSSLNMTNAYLHHKCLVSYSMMAFGDEPGMVSVTFLCRGDSFGPKCRSCFATAQSELRKRCPRDKGGIIWYDHCLVEFSSSDTTGQINYDDGFCMPSAKNVSGDRISFEKSLLVLISDLTRIAVTKKQRPPLYAAGEKRLGKKKLYVMVQCMLDLSEKGCEECMSHNVVHYQDCYKQKQGARVLGRSCNFRFELYPFVDPKSSPN